MTLSVLEDHSPIASLFKCDILYLWHVVRSRCIYRASYQYPVAKIDELALRYVNNNYVLVELN